MNPDQLKPGQRCASTSNRNFEGRQGYKGRTHLVSPQWQRQQRLQATLLIFGHSKLSYKPQAALTVDLPFLYVKDTPDELSMNWAAGAVRCVSVQGDYQLNTTVKADAAFLRRVFLALVFVTTITGGLAAFTTVQAMNANSTKACMFFCN